MSFADEVAASIKPFVRCRTCQLLAEMTPKDRDEIHAYILDNEDKARRISLALKARGVPVSESSVRGHAREAHEL